MTTPTKKKAKQTTKSGNNQRSTSRGRQSPRSSPPPREPKPRASKPQGTPNVQTRSSNPTVLVALDERNKPQVENWKAAGDRAAAMPPSQTSSDKDNSRNLATIVKEDTTSPTTSQSNQVSETQFNNRTSPQISTAPSKQNENDDLRLIND